MRLHLEALGGEVARRAPAAHFGVVVLVVAHRRGIGRHVRRAQQHLAQGLVGRFAIFADDGQLVVDGAHALLGGFGLVLLAGGHHLADRLRRGVALGLQRLLLRDGGAAGLIELGEARRIPRSMAVLHRLGDGFLVVADELDVEHSRAPSRWETIVPLVYLTGGAPRRSFTHPACSVGRPADALILHSAFART